MEIHCLNYVIFLKSEAEERTERGKERETKKEGLEGEKERETLKVFEWKFARDWT